MEIRFEIVGAGSMGMLYGAKLAKQNFQVRCWCRSSMQASALTASGISLIEQGVEKAEAVKVTATSFEDDASCFTTGSNDGQAAGNVDSLVYIIVAIKQSQLDDKFIEQLGQLCQKFQKVCIVALQNGIGHVEQIKNALPLIPVLTMVTSEAARKIDLTEVIHTGRGLTTIGDEQNKPENIELQKILLKAFEKAGFSTVVSKNIKEQVYQKLLVNVVINPLTALYHVSNGELPADPIRYKLMEQLFEETCTILALDGINKLEYKFEHILEVCQHTSANYSSMLQDILNHRTTEIQAINGAIVDLARQYGRRAPINESLVQLIEALQP